MVIRIADNVREPAMTCTILVGNALDRLAELPDQSVHMAVTSPPYWGLRSYKGDPGMIGLEDTFNEHVENLLAVFREVHRVLRDDGTFWLNYGDAYAGSGKGGMKHGTVAGYKQSTNVGSLSGKPMTGLKDGFKPKDLMLMPARIAMAMQDDGWCLRSEIVWSKPNPMPESVEDRPTSSHEKMFLFAKSGKTTYWTHPSSPGTRSVPEPDHAWQNRDTKEVFLKPPCPDWKLLLREDGSRLWRRFNRWKGRDYFYDHVAVRTPVKPESAARRERNDFSTRHVPPSAPSHSGIARKTNKQRGHSRHHDGFNDRWDSMTKEEQMAGGANLRNVWWLGTHPFTGAHFAVFPPKLVEPCIRAGTSEKGCCPSCGAPWARLVERHDRGVNPGAGRAVNEHRVGSHKGGTEMSRLGGKQAAFSTSGWLPTCDCDAGDPVPAVVLDPFAGAGTTGLVAHQEGRDSILIEISTEYAVMAAGRIAGAGAYDDVHLMVPDDITVSQTMSVTLP